MCLATSLVAILTFRPRADPLTGPQGHGGRHHRRRRATRQTAPHRRPRGGPGVPVAGPAGSRSAASRSSVTGTAAWSPRSSRPMGRHWSQVGVGGVGPGVPAVLEGLRRCRGRGQEGQARHVAGHLREALGVAGNSTAAGYPLTPERQPCFSGPGRRGACRPFAGPRG